MTGMRCIYCGKDCDSLPNRKGEVICAECTRGIELPIDPASG